MPQVFISYRQIDDAQRERVRAFAERLRTCGIQVVLDQWFSSTMRMSPRSRTT